MKNEVIVGWWTLAMIVAGIAQGKNRSGLNWFILTLIFGPLALIYLLLCDKLKEQPNEQTDKKK